MKCSRLSTPIPLIAGLTSVLLVAILAVPLGAQPASETRAGHGIGPVYDAAHEVTLNSAIDQVITKHTPGQPAGMHLIVTGPDGNKVDAHLGPFLNKETRESLQVGTPVRIVGAMMTLRGRSYLLTRLLTVNNRTITVRGEHGLLAPMAATGKRHLRAQTKPADVNGGAR